MAAGRGPGQVGWLARLEKEVEVSRVSVAFLPRPQPPPSPRAEISMSFKQA